MSVIVFGDTGFLGAALVRKFSDHNVLGVSSSGCRVYEGDCDGREYDLLDRTEFNGAQAIFAASVRYDPSLYSSSPWEMYQRNIAAVCDFVTLCEEYACSAIVHSSSQAVYGAAPRTHNENCPIDIGEYSEREFHYALAKLHQEQIIEQFAARRVIPISIARLTSMYGPGSTLDLANAHVIPAFILKMMHSDGSEIPAFGTGEEYRDFIFIEDVANIYKKILGQNIGRLNIGSGEQYSIKSLARLVEQHFDQGGTFSFSKAVGTSDVARRIVELNKLWRYVPKAEMTSFEEGIHETISWYQTQG